MAIKVNGQPVPEELIKEEMQRLERDVYFQNIAEFGAGESVSMVVGRAAFPGTSDRLGVRTDAHHGARNPAGETLGASGCRAARA